MGWFSESASRIESFPPSLGWRLAFAAGACELALLVILGSDLPVVSVVLLPLICWALWWHWQRSVAAVLLLASDSDQIGLNGQPHSLMDSAVIADCVSVRLEDGKGMRISLFLAPWNSRDDDRRRLRLWLARHQSESGR